jgi:hypothetical protein
MQNAKCKIKKCLQAGITGKYDPEERLIRLAKRMPEVPEIFPVKLLPYYI